MKNNSNANALEGLIMIFALKIARNSYEIDLNWIELKLSFKVLLSLSFFNLTHTHNFTLFSFFKCIK